MEVKSSVSKVQKSVGCYKFRIEGYSGLSTKMGDSIESPEFLLCGFQWQLRIFPGGSLESHRGYISYYLASKSNRVARASYKLSVCNQIAGADDESFASSGVRVFEAKGVQVDGWGRDKFMLATMLNDSGLGYCVDDVVIFKVDITVCGELEPSIITIIDNDSCTKGYSLDRCLQLLLFEQKDAYSDLDIIAGSTTTSFPSSTYPSSANLDHIVNSQPHPTSTQSTSYGGQANKGPCSHTICPHIGDFSCKEEDFSCKEEIKCPDSPRGIGVEEVKTLDCGYITKRSSSFGTSSVGEEASLGIGCAFSGLKARPPQVETIKAHRCVLMARSPVFKAMLGRNMKERRTGVLHITDFEPEIVREFLLFLYTDSLSSKQAMQEHCVALLSVAMKYEVRGLVDTCEVYLSSQINEETVIRILLVADEFAAFTLKEDALNFIAHHAEAIIQQREFKDLTGEVLAEATAVIEYAAKKKSCIGTIIDKERRFAGAPCVIM